MAAPPRGVFVIAEDDKSQQVCTAASNMMSHHWASFAELEEMALSECEELRRLQNISARCVKFAQNLDVVLDMDKYRAEAKELAARQARPILQDRGSQFFSNESTSVAAPGSTAIDADIAAARKKCTELGFHKKTEKFGDCVLKLSR